MGLKKHVCLLRLTEAMKQFQIDTMQSYYLHEKKEPTRRKFNIIGAREWFHGALPRCAMGILVLYLGMCHKNAERMIKNTKQCIVINPLTYIVASQSYWCHGSRNSIGESKKF